MTDKITTIALTALLIILLAGTDARAAGSELWPGSRYDSSIPTFEQILGHAPGQRLVGRRDAPALALGEALEDLGQLFGHRGHHSRAPDPAQPRFR